MTSYVVLPLWVLVLLLAGMLVLALVGAWVNAWVAVRFVRRGGNFLPSPAERLAARRDERTARRLLAAETLDEELLGPEDEGRVLP